VETELEQPATSPLSTASNGPRTGRDAPAPRTTARLTLIVSLLLIALIAAVLLSLSIGTIHVPVRAMLSALLLRHPLDETQHTILFAVRLPRVLASAIVGAALAVSGLVFQGLFRNPMADPYIIGASGGAAVGACIGIVFLSQFALFGFSATALLAFAGAVVAMTIVYALARTRGRTNSVTLLLAGFAIGTMLTNSTYIFEIFDPNATTGIRIVAAWLHGTIGIPQWSQLAVLSLLLAFALIAAFPLMRRLNTLALGDDYAHQLGYAHRHPAHRLAAHGDCRIAWRAHQLCRAHCATRRAPVAWPRPRASAAGHCAGRGHLSGHRGHACPHCARAVGAACRRPHGLPWRPVLPLSAAQTQA
jgi:iron complex transport system permease protein